jgi:hypothetical protein
MSTTAGLAESGYISSSQLYSTIQYLTIPFSTISPEFRFQFKASTTQLNFGKLGPTAQIYIGDVLVSSKDLVTTRPILHIEQEPIIFTKTLRFTYTGSLDTFVVPSGASKLSVVLKGAGGGTAITIPGGDGGSVTGDLAVTPGETLGILVGQAGARSGATRFGGGGACGVASFVGDGGGRSAIQRSGIDVVVAGGGGGGGNSGKGGNGGGTSGVAGTDGGSGGSGGGGTQTDGGAAGAGATVGALGIGGNGGGVSDPPSVGQGGGGGGGYFGGGGGGNDGSGGGGGSSYSALLTNATNVTGAGSAADIDGEITFTWVETYYRPGNLLEMTNYTARKNIIDPFLRTGINISTIDTRYYLDVSGGARVSSLTLGTHPSTGVLGTNIAGNLFWNGVQINGGGGGGDLTTANLTSTVIGLGTVGYISTASGGGGLTTTNLTSTVIGLGTVGYVSSLLNLVSTNNLLELVSTPNLLNLVSTSYLDETSRSSFIGLGTLGYISTASGGGITTTNLVSTTSALLYKSVAVLTLGATDFQLNLDDVGKYFLFTQSNAGTNILMPAAQNGWNVVLKNMPASSENITVVSGSSAILAPGVGTTVVCDGTIFYSL